MFQAITSVVYLKSLHHGTLCKHCPLCKPKKFPFILGLLTGTLLIEDFKQDKEEQ